VPERLFSQFVVPGHGLVAEGAAHTSNKPSSCLWCPADAQPGTRAGSRSSGGVSGEGHGRCSCGEQSEHLLSGAARRRWHYDHKAAHRTGGTPS
jgi:hypothetical protein